MVLRVLNVAEKPSVAKEIAAILGGPRTDKVCIVSKSLKFLTLIRDVAILNTIQYMNFHSI